MTGELQHPSYDVFDDVIGLAQRANIFRYMCQWISFRACETGVEDGQRAKTVEYWSQIIPGPDGRGLDTLQNCKAMLAMDYSLLSVVLYNFDADE